MTIEVAELRRLGIACAAAVVGMSPLLSPAQGQDRPNFQGKTINLVVGFPVGGGYDVYTRLVARYLGAHLPGNPAVVVQNMPGAGGLVSMNHMYKVAPRDGTSLGVVTPTAAIHQRLFPEENVLYDVRDVTWVGRITSNTAVQYAWHQSKFRSIDEIKTREVVVAGTGPTSASVVIPLLLNALTGSKIKVVSGYRGTSDAHLALERGEVEAVSTNWSSLKPDATGWLRDKKIKIVLQFGSRRHPDLADVPAVIELAQDDEQRQIFEFFASADNIGVAILAPPGLDSALIATLRKAFDETMGDPALIEEARKRQIDIDLLPGAELQKIPASVFSTPARLVERAKLIINSR